VRVTHFESKATFSTLDRKRASQHGRPTDFLSPPDRKNPFWLAVKRGVSRHNVGRAKAH